MTAEERRYLREKRRQQGRRYAQARRDRLKMSQVRLARCLGVDTKTIKRREAGQRPLRRWHWLALCGVQQVSALDGLAAVTNGTMAPLLAGEGPWAAVKREAGPETTQAGAARRCRTLPAETGRMLEEMRTSCGVSPIRWADSLGVSEDTVRNLEADRFGVTREMFFATLALFLQARFAGVDLERVTHRNPHFGVRVEGGECPQKLNRAEKRCHD